MKRMLGAAVVAAAVMAVAAPQAGATDNVPCHSPRDKVLVNPKDGRQWPSTVRTCNLTRGHVPVYESRNPGSRVVGELVQGGGANWFVFENKGATFKDGSAENNWWASTQADNGAWGWVPEVYFAGGDNYEDDAGLLMPGGYTCANVCPPAPPWMW
ncbi:hypothetical protein [Streptomyces sp. NBC_01465]|uniref:hypothetical protein n=1 Tax=Streptomyces sp. NBC_01465 TaxID=2903878 RepID=UPI003FCE3537